MLSVASSMLSFGVIRVEQISERLERESERSQLDA